jgi:cytochrome c-type biogenesis protein CcmH
MMAGTLKVLLAAAILVLACQALAKEPLIFMNPEQEARYNKLTLELRCLVCQNQNLADSDAPLAQDLRKEIYNLMQAGQSNEEIKMFLVDRYGDFVLYKPPVKGNTLALWLAPAVLLLGGGLVVVFIVRKRTRMFAEHKKENQ